jgi:hypothetical protein
MNAVILAPRGREPAVTDSSALRSVDWVVITLTYPRCKGSMKTAIVEVAAIQRKGSQMSAIPWHTIRHRERFWLFEANDPGAGRSPRLSSSG